MAQDLMLLAMPSLRFNHYFYRVNFHVYSLLRLSGVQSANMMRELYRCVWASLVAKGVAFSDAQTDLPAGPGQIRHGS